MKTQLLKRSRSNVTAWLTVLSMLAIISGGAEADVFDRIERLQEQVNEAKSDLENQNYRLASKKYMQLWRNRYKNTEFGVDMHSMSMVQDLSVLAEHHERFRDFFMGQRSMLERHGEAPQRQDPLKDWIAINYILGDGQLTLDWYDLQVEDPEQFSLPGGVRSVLTEQLIHAARWSDLWPMYPAPMGELTVAGQRLDVQKPPLHPGVPREHLDRMLESRKRMMAQLFDETAARQYAVVVASGQVELAEQVWNHALSFRRVPELKVAMLEQAIESGFADETHLAKLKSIKLGTPGLLPLQNKLEKRLAEAEDQEVEKDDPATDEGEADTDLDDVSIFGS